MDSANELQDLYSSTSSDDQSSINSVVHVEALLDPSESDTTSTTTASTEDVGQSEAIPPRRERQNNESSKNAKNGNGAGRAHTKTHPESGEMEHPTENGRYVGMEDRRHTPRQVDFAFEDERQERNHRNASGLHENFMIEGDDSSSEDEDEDERRRREEEEQDGGRDSDSSSTSEDTQMRTVQRRNGRWVQQAKGRHHPHQSTPNGHGRPKVPPKPGYSGGVGSPSGSVGPPLKRQSVVSQGSMGKAETRLLAGTEDTTGAGDSGLSTESQETHSIQGDNPHFSHHHHHHHHPDPQTTRCYIQYLSDPHGAPGSSQRPLSTSTTSSQPPGGGYQKRTSLGMYQHSSPSHQSSRDSPIIPLHAVPSPSPSPIPPTLLMRNGEPSSQSVGSPLEGPGSLMRENLFNVLSFLYAIFLVVMGTSLPLAEIFAQSIPMGVFEGFYIYLYVTSILFLIYVYLVLLRSSTSHCCRRRRSHVHDEMQREDSLLNHASVWRQKAVYVNNQNHTGSFYLRLGAVGFGIGSMIHEGLMFGHLFERELIWECINVAMVIRPVTQLVFTFVQLYFIFLNSKMLIHKYKVFARFGLMHMIATNLCVWLRVIFNETLREFNNSQNTTNTSWRAPAAVTPSGVAGDHKYASSVANFDEVKIMPQDTADLPARSNNSSTDVGPLPSPAECVRHDFMSNVVGAASPYLYPCTIQYSLIAAAILFVMWRNIGFPPPVTPSSMTDSEGDLHRHKKNNRVAVDCSGANRGLFFGIFTLVGIIISMIVFFVLVDKPGFHGSAIIVTHSSEIVLHFLATLAVFVAAGRIRRLKFHPDRDNHLEEMLLVVSLVGVYILGIFSVVAGRHMNSTSFGCPLVIASSVLIIFQATCQTVFIMNGLRRSAISILHERRKPGREFVTFLLVCNIAMLGMNTFETLRSDANPVALTFYGHLAWNIVTHMTTPLAIFYRFHSVVCLATMWQGAYKLKFH